MNKYAVSALLIGPYLPSNELVIGDIRIVRNAEPIKWEAPKTPIEAVPGGDGESMIAFTPLKITIGTSAYMLWEGEAESSKEASELSKKAFSRVCDVLSVACIEDRYFYQVVIVDQLAGGVDPESPLSEPLHIVSYESTGTTQEFNAYAQAIADLDDTKTKEIVEAFGESLRKYDTLGLYKVIENITHVLIPEVQAAQPIYEVNEEKEKLIDELSKLLRDESRSLKQRVNAIKRTADDIKRLNMEQNRKRVMTVAEYLGLKGAAAKVIDDAIKYRNSTLAHHNSGAMDQNKGVKDIQESARFFLINYLKIKFGLALPTMPGVKHWDYWYSFTYFNSSAESKD